MLPLHYPYFSLLLFHVVSSSFSRMSVSPEAREFNEEKSKLMTELLLKRLQDVKCQSDLKAKSLGELFFHTADPKLKVKVSRPSLSSNNCFRVTNLTSDFLSGGLQISVNYSVLEVTASLHYQEDSDIPIALLEHEAQCGVRLLLYNVSGSGVCFTNWTESAFSVVECDLHFSQRDHEGVSQHLACPEIFPSERNEVFVRGTSFQLLLEDKLWRSVTERLCQDVRTTIHRQLQEESFVKVINKPTVLQPYRNYVIESTHSANEFVDSIMVGVKKILMEKFHDRIKIPNITETFERRVLVITWRGSFRADHGTVRGLASVVRAGDTSFATDNASQTHFFGNLRFKELDLFYERYQVEFMSFVGVRGTLSTRLRPIRLHFHPFVNFGTGKIYLEDFKIEDVGELAMQVTGLGFILDWLLSLMTTWVVGLVRDSVLDDLQRKYHDHIRSVLSGYSIDDIITGKVFD